MDQSDVIHALASALDLATMDLPEGTALAYTGPPPDLVETAERTYEILTNWGFTLDKTEPRR